MDLAFPLRSVFAAVPLEGEAKRRFSAWQEALRPFADALRFQPPASPHLTLMFFPVVQEPEFSGITSQCRKLAEESRPFTFSVRGARTFGEGGRDRVLTLAPQPSLELAELKQRCPWTDLRPFVPHVTLGWIADAERFSAVKKDVMKLLGEATFPVPADRIRLYAEVRGAKQTVLEEFLFP